MWLRFGENGPKSWLANRGIDNMAKKLKVTLIRSGINRPEQQKRTIRALGLRKMHKTVVLPDNTAVRGMIRTVPHLVKVEAAE